MRAHMRACVCVYAPACTYIRRVWYACVRGIIATKPLMHADINFRIVTRRVHEWLWSSVTLAALSDTRVGALVSLRLSSAISHARQDSVSFSDISQRSERRGWRQFGGDLLPMDGLVAMNNLTLKLYRQNTDVRR